MSYDAYNSALSIYKNELQEFEQKRKRQIVQDLAKMLELAGYPTEMISEKIADDLAGYISDRYVREVLDDKYKNVRRLRSTPAIDDNKVTEETEKKKEIVVTNDGNVAPESTTKFSTADETLDDDDDEDAARTPATVNYTADFDKDARIAELEEALKQTQMFKPATAIATENKTDELFLSMDHWSTMFMIMRNGEKKGFWCKHNGKEILSVEANYVRAKAQAQQQKVKAK